MTSGSATATIVRVFDALLDGKHIDFDPWQAMADLAQIRLRLAVDAGEVLFDRHGVTGMR